METGRSVVSSPAPARKCAVSGAKQSNLVVPLGLYVPVRGTMRATPLLWPATSAGAAGTARTD